MEGVYIVAAARTPIGSLNGSLSSVSAVKLGALALKGVEEGAERVEIEALKKHEVPLESVEELFFGNALSANLGQAPARQVALEAELSKNVICTSINKVCSSGLKAMTLAAQTIMCGGPQVIAVVGAESMSRTPYYIQGGKKNVDDALATDAALRLLKDIHSVTSLRSLSLRLIIVGQILARTGMKMGHGELTDGVIKDGLWDPINNFHMGMAAEICSETYGISREAQDAYTIQSYRRAAEAYKCGLFASEIVPVDVPTRSGPKTVQEDEEYTRVNFEKLPKLKPIFKAEGGTVTAANASPVNDGGAAVVLMSAEKVRELGVIPIAKVLGFADAEKSPEEFTTAPSAAIPKALKHAGLDISDVDIFEINEAFAVVALANIQILGLDPEKVNVFGGSVALGHPLGCSGVRILVTLLNVLDARHKRVGVAAICNGGGGSTSVVVERTEKRVLNPAS